MACHRRSLGHLAMLVALGLLALGPDSALGQAERPLSSDLIGADELTEQQQQRITRYVEHWNARLLAEDNPATVAQAQRRLSEPLRNPVGPSDAFLETYNEPLIAGLEQAMASEQSVTRLNAMIVAAHLPPEPGAVLGLVRRGVEDENAAVRYRALKAVYRIAVRHGWSEAQQVELVQVLTQSLRVEPVRLVVRQVMLALVELEVADAMERTLEALNQRAEAHQEDPGRSLDPEYVGLEQLFGRLLEGDDADAASADIRELSRTGYRYVRFAAAALDQEAVPEENFAAYQQVIGLSDQILHEAHNQLEATQPAPDRMSIDLERGDWAAILDKADQWGAILQEPPFNFSAGELALAPGDE